MDLQEIEAEIKEIDSKISAPVFKNNSLLKLKENLNKKNSISKKIGGGHGN